VLGLLHDLRAIARCRAAFGPRFALLERTSELLPAIRSRTVEILFLEPLDRCGNPTAPLVRRLRRVRRGLRVVVWMDLSARNVDELASLGNAGLDKVLICDTNDDVISLRQLLREGSLHRVVARAIEASGRVAQAHLFPLVKFLLEHANERVRVCEIETALGVGRRTLSRWAKDAGLRGIRAVRVRSRLLVAIGLVCCESHAPEEAALRAGFSSVAHLRGALDRHAHARTRDLATRPHLGHWCKRLFSSNRLEARRDHSDGGSRSTAERTRGFTRIRPLTPA